MPNGTIRHVNAITNPSKCQWNLTFCEFYGAFGPAIWSSRLLQELRRLALLCTDFLHAYAILGKQQRLRVDCKLRKTGVRSVEAWQPYDVVCACRHFQDTNGNHTSLVSHPEDAALIPITPTPALAAGRAPDSRSTTDLSIERGRKQSSPLRTSLSHRRDTLQDAFQSSPQSEPASKRRRITSSASPLQSRLFLEAANDEHYTVGSIEHSPKSGDNVYDLVDPFEYDSDSDGVEPLADLTAVDEPIPEHHPVEQPPHSLRQSKKLHVIMETEHPHVSPSDGGATSERGKEEQVSAAQGSESNHRNRGAAASQKGQEVRASATQSGELLLDQHCSQRGTTTTPSELPMKPISMNNFTAPKLIPTNGVSHSSAQPAPVFSIQSAISSLGPGNWVNGTALEHILSVFNPYHSRFHVVEVAWVNPSLAKQPVRRYRPTLTATDAIVVPLCHSQAHWTVGIIYPKRGQLEVYDPLNKQEMLDASVRALHSFSRTLDCVRQPLEVQTPQVSFPRICSQGIYLIFLSLSLYKTMTQAALCT
jgi:hypothetical protein